MTNLSMISTEVTTAIAQNTSEHSTESIKGIAWAINEYGPLVVALACFILAFVLLSRLIINQNNKLVSTFTDIIKNYLLPALIENNNGSKTPLDRHIEKDLFEIFMEIDESIKGILKNIQNMTSAERVSVYAIHNGTFSSHGLPFFKTSCISEVLKNSIDIGRKVSSHVNLPLSSFDDSLNDLYRNGIVFIPDVDEVENKYPVIYRMLKESEVKSAAAYALYDQEKRVLGILIIEFINPHSSECFHSFQSDIDSCISSLSPILEYSNFQKTSSSVKH